MAFSHLQVNAPRGYPNASATSQAARHFVIFFRHSDVRSTWGSRAAAAWQAVSSEWEENLRETLPQSVPPPHLVAASRSGGADGDELSQPRDDELCAHSSQWQQAGVCEVEWESEAMAELAHADAVGAGMGTVERWQVLRDEAALAEAHAANPPRRRLDSSDAEQTRSKSDGVRACGGGL